MQQLVRCQVPGSFYNADREWECDCMGCIAQQMYVYRTAPFPNGRGGWFSPLSSTVSAKVCDLKTSSCFSSTFCVQPLCCLFHRAHSRAKAWATDPKLTCTALVHVRMGIASTDRTSMGTYVSFFCSSAEPTGSNKDRNCL